jgi:putative ABC transport system permease protein
VRKTIIHDYLQSGSEVHFGKLMSWGGIIGVNIDDLADMGLKAARGTTELSRGTMVIGSWVPQNFYNPNPRPGEEMTGTPELLDQVIRLVLVKYTQDGEEVRRTFNVRVVGILEETRGMADGNMYMRLDEVTAFSEWGRGTRINRDKEGYGMLIVKAEDPDVVLDIADQINALGYMANTPQSYLEGINSFFLVLQIIFGGVGAIALLVAAIGIANTMAMAILERTREIGLMKAVGATNRDVLSIFLGEAAGIGFVGGLGGVALGWGASAILNVVALSYFASQAANGGGSLPTAATSTPFWLPVFALVFATVIGLLSGLYPALRAASLVPVNALKYE